MKKQLLTFTLTLLTVVTTFAQEVWYDIDNAVTDMIFTATASCDGCTVTTVANPDTGDTTGTTNVTLWQIPGTLTPVLERKILNFTFPANTGVLLADYSTLTVTVRFYFPEFDYQHNFDLLDRFRLYLADANGNISYVQRKFLEVNEGSWHQLVFDYSSPTAGTAPTGPIVSGEIRTVYQAARFTNLDNNLDYHIDTVTSNKALNSTLSVESETLKNNSLKLVSNPVINTLEVSKLIKSATIYNLQGKALKTYDNAAETKFDVSNLSTGVYLFQAKLDTGSTQTLRFVKK